MVAHLGPRTHVLFYEEIGTIIAEILSVWEKAEKTNLDSTFKCRNELEISLYLYIQLRLAKNIVYLGAGKKLRIGYIR